LIFSAIIGSFAEKTFVNDMNLLKFYAKLDITPSNGLEGVRNVLGWKNAVLLAGYVVIPKQISGSGIC